MSVKQRVAFESHSEQQTFSLAESLAKELKPGDIVALEGPLGSGKTCFVRGLARGLGIPQTRVSSPTFIICQEYENPTHAGIKLIHVDAYRLRSIEELETIGWREMLEAGEGVIAVEWPSRIAEAMPEQRIDVNFAHAGEQVRLIEIAVPPSRASRLQDINIPATEDVKGQLKCRTCGKPIEAASRYFPFCSERCRMADLGKWFSESYRTTRAIEADDELEE